MFKYFYTRCTLRVNVIQGVGWTLTEILTHMFFFVYSNRKLHGLSSLSSSFRIWSQIWRRSNNKEVIRVCHINGLAGLWPKISDPTDRYGNPNCAILIKEKDRLKVWQSSVTNYFLCIAMRFLLWRPFWSRFFVKNL